MVRPNEAVTPGSAADALFKAVYEGDLEAVGRLLAADRRLARAQNAFALSVLQFARFMGSAAVLGALVDAGPPLDVFEAAMLDRDEELRRIVGADASLARAHGDDGFTPLHLAAFYGAARAATVLLDAGADIHARTKNFLDNQALHAAAAGSMPLELSTLLLEHGADANARQHGANAPLHTAGFRGDRALTDLLLAHRADPAARNDEGKIPAEVAASQGHAALATLLDMASRTGG